MADSAAVQAARYPLAVYNFRVIAGEVDISVAEITGLEREYPTLTYLHGLSAWEGEDIVRYRIDRWQALTLKKAVVTGATAFYEWLESGEKRTLAVRLCDHTGTAVVTWRASEAMVVKIVAPAFQASTNEAAIDTITLMALGIGIDHD